MRNIIVRSQGGEYLVEDQSGVALIDWPIHTMSEAQYQAEAIQIAERSRDTLGRTPDVEYVL
jgi:hypothetical protein